MMPQLHRSGICCAGFRVLSAVLLAGFLGCSTKPSVDWGSRVGQFTFDEAVLEMGPPDKSTDLADGTRVGDWYTGRAPTVSFGFGVGSYGHGGGVGVGQGVTTGGAGRYLRLIFDADGMLQSVDKVVR